MAKSKITQKKKDEERGISLDQNKQKEFLEKLDAIDSEEILKPGTVYIGHLPRGFYEDQIRQYFAQFGTVNKVRLARSKKTGGYKGYGYIQFACEDVAKIAAEAMNNYLMFDRLIRCEYVKDENLHTAVWKGANKKFVWCDRRKRHAALHNKEKSREERKKQITRSLRKDKAKKEKLLSLGIKYQFPKLAGKLKEKKMRLRSSKTAKELTSEVSKPKKIKKAKKSLKE